MKPARTFKRASRQTPEAHEVALWEAERRDAYLRAEKGLPLNAKQAGFVLGMTQKGVEMLVVRMLLRRRWPGTATPYHPEDLHEYLERQSVRFEAERRAQAAQQPQEAHA